MRPIAILGACALISLAGPAFAAHRAATDVRQVLPDTLTPSHYDLKLTPDAEHLTFRGVVTVAGVAAKAGRTVVLNAKGLTLDGVDLDGRKAASIRLDDKLGRATLTFAEPYAAGRHSLQVAYHGPITSKGTLGFFAMDYDSPAGKRRTLATNFEPAEARRLLPCWDEPGKKATFTVTVDAPADRMAVSNMPVAETTPLAGGLQRVRFAETPKMSTYLLFLGVGDFERVHQTVDGVEVGVVFKRGDERKAAYGLSQAVALLHYYNGYFGVRFPLPKLDLVAAPGEIAGGSMENWGAIFYSQDHLLFDPASSTERERQQVFLVVSHEMAHQWFGDLVTMAWWDNLWLNEGFARWMQTHAADALHPEWKTGLQAAAIFEGGKHADAQVTTHPVLQPIGSAEQAAEAFDQITYDKGAAVITMLEAYVGADAFRDGVRRYMKAHAFGNTVDNDLWSQVQAAAGKPVRDIEHDFTRQAGVPLVRVTAEKAGVRLTEGRFAEDPDSLKGVAATHWRIPLAVAGAGKPPTTLILTDAAAVPGQAPLVNAGGMAYARVAYPSAQAQALAQRLGSLSAMDQINLMNDASALGGSGYAPASVVLDFMARLPADADPVVWTRAVFLLHVIDDGYRGLPGQAAFHREALRLIAPLAKRLGTAPTPGEASNVTTLRATVWGGQARFGDGEALARAKSIFSSGQGSIAEQRAALGIVAEAADATTFDALLVRAHDTKDPQEKGRILRAMAAAADPDLSSRIVGIALGSEAPAGSAPQLLSIAGDNNPDAVWEALRSHLGKDGLPMDEQTAWEVVSDIAAGSADPKRIADIRAYGEAVIPADARRPVESAVGSIKLNQRIRAKAIPDIDRWLAAHGAG
ncbi:M1 family metallopeptidase [Phenylobacterium sp.]|uniref:M1 family metallopeptidase n=1 Tax=Phenylobacterium sp. TaxID=1871053 RepID=UPI0025E434DB|nr:M1 family metallopeptidase [Phenylobacterium sp.]